MSKLGKITRRVFMVGAATVVGGVAVGAYAISTDPKNPLSPKDGATLNSYVIIDKDGVTIIVPRAEMGQGVQTSLAALVAEELEVALEDIRIEHGPPARAYAVNAFTADRSFDAEPPAKLVNTVMEAMPRFMGMQVTGGSTSTMDAFTKHRLAGATAREMLIEAAAQRLKVGRDQLTATNGTIVATDGSVLRYSELAEDAAKVSPPKNPRLKRPEEWTLIGKTQAKLDQPAKATGTAPFAGDTRLPGMKFATVKMTPRIGGEMLSYDAAEALSMPGVEKVIDLGHGVAVVANNTWLAIQAAETIQFDWGPAPYGDTTEAVFSDLEAAFDTKPNVTPHEHGEISEGDSDHVVEYRAPFLSHAPMEPMNATALFTGDALELWAGVQGPIQTRSQAAKAAGLKPDQVTLHTTIMGGSFGRRGFNDFAIYAAQVAAAMPNTPVNVTWSREEDMRHDHYRPGAIARMRARLDGDRVAMLKADLAAPSVLSASMKAIIGREINGPDATVTEGVAEQPYGFENLLIRGYVPERAPRVGFWRSVGNSQNAFFMESFMDELAHLAGADPLAFRLAHMKGVDAETETVLRIVGEMAGWTGKTPASKGRGVAVTYSFGTPVAEIIEVSDVDGAVKIDKVWIAADLGKIIDPGNVETQLIGGAIYGLSAAIHDEITFEDGAVVQENFWDHDALRMNTTPDFEVKALALGGPVGGVGEPGTPPAAPALANAIFDLTGTRLRQMPFHHEIDFYA